METITVQSIPIVVGAEEDGRWWADIESMPGAKESRRHSRVRQCERLRCGLPPTALITARKRSRPAL